MYMRSSYSILYDFFSLEINVSRICTFLTKPRFWIFVSLFNLFLILFVVPNFTGAETTDLMEKLSLDTTSKSNDAPEATKKVVL